MTRTPCAPPVPSRARALSVTSRRSRAPGAARRARYDDRALPQHLAPRAHMKSESIVFGVAGTFFGLIAGWLIGSQQAVVRPAAPPAQAAAAPTGSGGGAAAAPRL